MEMGAELPIEKNKFVVHVYNACLMLFNRKKCIKYKFAITYNLQNCITLEMIAIAKNATRANGQKRNFQAVKSDLFAPFTNHTPAALCKVID